MKKTLTAICATFLLAAPIQIASAATNTTEGNSVKQTTNCKVYYKWSNNHKWNIQFPQASTPSKETPTTNNNNTATTPNNNQSSQNEKPATPPTSSTPSTTTSDVNAFEQEVVKLTNAERTKAGLSPLQTDDKLMAAAREKSQDMQSNNYFSHTSPTFGSPFDRMKALGIAYKSAGENIAQGQRSPQEVVQAWMDSPGHRANILNGEFTHIGVGYVKSGNYWTQQFITK
ncbi:CAP domain-containing protein [Lysinibacillus fusiformis]|uniref:CAP domain-containing protein n=1 Tax=Lysinibacillus fusiformis TaxID=28031 RepID=UPI001F4D9F13|nr:CAP domain-containing protein [Lysinibacillus fusiformis]MCK1988042.1 CAP domain-containing protein [Lysinibacillus fusiformis]